MKRTNLLSDIYIPVSIGELIDKITILEIKKENMNGIQLNNVKKELKFLKTIVHEKNIVVDINLISLLREVNNNIWKIEDKIRQKEYNEEFDKDFIELARSVYKQNDKRASIKRDINYKYNSDLIEEKSYNDNLR